VDCWPLAIICTRHLGAGPYRYPASAVTGGRYPPLEWHMSQLCQPSRLLIGLMWRTVTWGIQWGQLDDSQGPVVANAQVSLGGRGVRLE
jgi:hypothetical protein